MPLWLWCVIAYIAGSIPTGYLVARLLRGIDIRRHGSGNPGATNVYRVVGPVPGIVTFFLDALKGFLPVFFAARQFGTGNVPAWLLVGLCAILGHIFTVFLRFRGGKGVATAAGVFFALLPVPALLALLVFAVVLAVFRYVSLGSILAAVALPFFAAARGEPRFLTGFAAIIGAVIIYKHKSNIRRLVSGTEHKFGTKPSSEGGHHE